MSEKQNQTANSSPRIARLTPVGRGAVATFVVFGTGSAEVVLKAVQLPSSRASEIASHPVLGRIGGDTGEEVVIFRKSEEAFFIHGHGGTAAVAALEEELLRAGASHAEWQEWMKSFPEKSSVAKEASIALAFASTERTAGILLDQMAGALDTEIDQLRQELYRGDSADALSRTETLLTRLPIGLHLTAPWHIAIAGRPNVGKSSLINALVGYSRAIVHETPGTTRDVVSAQVVFDGFPMMLYDTAGIRDDADRIERSGIDRARRRIADSDLALLVFDGSILRTDEDIAFSNFVNEWQSDTIAVYNKSDLPQTGPVPKDAICVSALQNTGLAILIDAIVGRLIPIQPPAGAAVPFTKEQGIGLAAVAESLRHNDHRSAMAALNVSFGAQA